jgi:signal transduction histidine kinase
MKIRDRLTLTFSLTALVALSALGVFIYSFTRHFHEVEFFGRLLERVEITEKVLLEKNDLVTEAVREKFLKTLDQEKEYVIKLDEAGKDSLDRLFYKGLSEDIKKKEAVYFTQKEWQGVAKHYLLPTGEFAVVVIAIDVFGKSKLGHLSQILPIGMMLCTALLIIIGWFATKRALKPLEDKIRKASNIGASRLDLRLTVQNPNDEIGELAITFNQMLDRLQDAFEAQRQFVSNASHEIRNPLTAIIGESEVILNKERSVDEYKEAIETIQKEAVRLETLTGQLLELAKAEAVRVLPEPQEISFELLLLECLEKFPPDRLEMDLPDEDTDRIVLANARLLDTAITNIVDNALKYSDQQPVSVVLADLADQFELKIIDRGIGIPPSDLSKIFQPLFRARNARSRKGHGVGLALSQKIIELHHGSLHFDSELEKGTSVTIRLPKLKF